jgi:hypothetical protein
MDRCGLLLGLVLFRLVVPPLQSGVVGLYPIRCTCFPSHVSLEGTGLMRFSIVGVFCIGKIQGGQDCAFLFRGGLVNYKTHYNLSWFIPLLGGNSTTFNSLILKMNSGYNGGEQRAQEAC